jgi:hypothetical protein
MKLRLLTVLLVLAAALTAPAAGWATDGGESGQQAAAAEPAEPEPIPEDFWTQGPPPSDPASDTSTSPGGTAPGSGTVTTGSGAQASSPSSPATPRQTAPAETEPACDPPATLRLALRSLRRAVTGRNLLDERARPVPVRIAPCRAGLYELAIVLEGTDTVLWRARRDLGKGVRRATLRLAMTSAGRRFVARTRRSGGGVVRMRLRARLYPSL